MKFLPVVLLVDSDWGFDCIWCQAAAFYAQKHLHWSDTDSLNVCILILYPGMSVRHTHQTWSSLASSSKELSKTSAGRFAELNSKLKLNQILMSILKTQFPSWYLPGDDPIASPQYRYPNNGTFKWNKFSQLRLDCND